MSPSPAALLASKQHDAPAEAPLEEIDAEAMIQVTDLTMGWDPEKPLLEHASFKVNKGEVFAILGGSGCGKSTMMRYLIGLEQPLAGRVLVGGQELGAIEGHPPTFGVMFQGGALFGSMSVVENVSLPLDEWTDLPHDAVTAIATAKLRLVGLADAADKSPSELSGGMKKRAAIARAMALEPTLLFLDEPSAGLDPVTSADLDDLIKTLCRVVGLTVVLVTHELPSIFAIVDRCIMLDKETKRIIAEGDPNELKDSDDPKVNNFFNRKSKES